jgi:alkylation response protein AidB-like acyl-CoA dehydrogenase
MDRFAHTAWPFFDAAHAALAREAERWALAHAQADGGEDTDSACRRLVRSLGAAGLLRHCAPPGAEYDVRAIALVREVLAYHSGLADFAFAMQGLGSAPIALAGSAAQKARWLARVASGEAIAAFALSEPEAGSDAAALAARARPEGASWRLDGVKTWISNGGIADFYVVFARSAEGIGAFLVEANEVDARERIETSAPHPMATLRLEGARAEPLGTPAEGLRLALRTLDVFRTTVAAAALGFARRALDLALARARSRRMFGVRLADLQMTQAKLAEMACAVDAAALLAYRAAWLRDVKGERITREAAMAKMHATEAAQAVVDAALQLHGALGVVREHPLERLYREVRALRIYEGATEVQKVIVARELLKEEAS